MNSASRRLVVAVVMTGGLGLAMTTAAQDPAPAPSAREDWTTFSRSGTRAYLADIGGMTSGDTVSIRLARTPLNREAGDYSHTIDDYQFQCAAGQVRTVASTEYGPDGVQTDRFEDPTAWEDIPANSLDAYLKAVACDGARTTSPTWPSIKAYIDAGRP